MSFHRADFAGVCFSSGEKRRKSLILKNTTSRSVPLFMFYTVLIISGGVSLSQLPLEYLPLIQNPHLDLFLSLPTCDPDYVASNLTPLLEQELLTLKQIRKVTTTISSNNAQLSIYMRKKNLAAAEKLNLENKIKKILFSQKKFRQAEFYMQSSVDREEAVAHLIMTDISGAAGLEELVRTTLLPRLELLDGVTKTAIRGVPRNEIEIVVDELRLENSDLLISDISSRMPRHLTPRHSLLGSVSSRTKKLPVYLVPKIYEKQNIGEFPLHLPSTAVPLNRVSTVRSVLKDPDTYYLIDGKQCGFVDIFSQRNKNLVKLCGQLKRKVDQWSKTLSEKYPEMALMDFQIYAPEYDRFMALVKTLMVAVFLIFGWLALLALYFLRTLRPVILLVVALAVALALNFLVMLPTGQTINIFTLTGIFTGVIAALTVAITLFIISLGPKMQKVPASDQGRLQTGKFSATPLFLVSLICFIFVIPLFSLPEQVRAIIRLSDSVIYTLRIFALPFIVILIVSIPVILSVLPSALVRGPQRAYQFPGRLSGENRFAAGYQKRLNAIIRDRWRGAVLILFLLASGSFLLKPYLVMTTVSAIHDRDWIRMAFQTVSDADLAETVFYVKQVEQLLHTRAEINTLWTTVEQDYIQFDMQLASQVTTREKTQQLSEKVYAMAKWIPGIQVTSGTADGGGDDFYSTFSSTHALRYRGPYFGTFADLKNNVRKCYKLYNVKIPPDEKLHYCSVSVDPEKLIQQGLSLSTVGQNLSVKQDQGLTIGFTGEPWSDQRSRLRLLSATHSDLEKSGQNISSGQSPLVRKFQPILGNVMLNYDQAPIVKENGIREIVLPLSFSEEMLYIKSYNIPEGAERNMRIQRFLSIMNNIIGSMNLPPGATVELLDYEKEREKEFDTLSSTVVKAYLPLLLLLVIILFALYETVVVPLCILLVLSSVITLTIWTLILTLNPLHEFSYCGLFLIATLATIQSLFILDFLRQNKKGPFSFSYQIKKALHRQGQAFFLSSTVMVLISVPFFFSEPMLRPLGIVLSSGVLAQTLGLFFLLPLALYCSRDLKNLGHYITTLRYERSLALEQQPRSIEVRHLGKIYQNGFRALNGVSLKIEAGVFGLLGPNGAGKTTLMQIIVGTKEQTSGVVYLGGHSRKEFPDFARRMVGYLPQEFDFYENYTAQRLLEQRLILYGIVSPLERRKSILTVLEAVGLGEVATQKIHGFSGGMKRRLGLAILLLRPPPLIIVDEPTVGLDPESRVHFRTILTELSKKSTILLSTHIVEDVEKTCDHLAIMNKGKIIYVGTRADLIARVRRHVWEIVLNEAELQAARKKYIILDKRRVPQGIRCRLLSADKPHPRARPLNPKLEDAYVYCLHTS
ncbi:efflux RND transporter permease subunit [candidate division CSSED10-310 bacterium]|uniref:Efflux RND transporter permease subunit n=1 Tax=candidate division CSSED10-310 bacterium TaxID=2855610 RepID=A0ABV6YSB2_UNCC1